MDMDKHHCNKCPLYEVILKRYPSGYFNITVCTKYKDLKQILKEFREAYKK